MSYANLSANSAHTQLPESVRSVDSKGVVETWLTGRPASTVRSYKSDLRRFCRWLGVDEFEQAASVLLGRDSAAANRQVIAYAAALRAQGMAVASVNRSVTALRSLARNARLTGRSDVQIDVPTEAVRRPKPKTPTAHEMRRVIDHLRERANDPIGKRNLAVGLLLAVHGLRRAEVSGIDVADYDGTAVYIRGKGRGGQRDRITLVPAVRDAIDAWLEVRTQHAIDGALFVCLTGPGARGRLAGDGIYRMLRKLGAEVDWDGLRPHLLRRAAITAALDSSDGDVRAAQRFARHSDPAMTLHYDACRRDMHAQSAAAVGAAILG